MPTLETNRLLAVAVDACDSRKAEDIRILALDPSESSLTDYFLICSGTNERQNGAIADEIELRLKREFNTYPNSVEGRRQGEWILMDYVDFVVHIFMPEKRAYYGLERLRKSAKSISLDELNGEIKAAVEDARKKSAPAKKSATAAAKKSASPRSTASAKKAREGTSATTTKRAGKTARKRTSKVSDALKPAAKKAAKRTASAAKKGAAKRSH